MAIGYRYEVRRTTFHGGHTISRHISLKEAEKVAKRETVYGCTCGCAYLIPLTAEAKQEMLRTGRYYFD